MTDVRIFYSQSIFHRGKKIKQTVKEIRERERNERNPGEERKFIESGSEASQQGFMLMKRKLKYEK